MRLIIAISSVALILAGLYFTVGSYIGYARSVEVCQNYACSTQPVFPTLVILIGSVMIIVGISTIIVRNRLMELEFMRYKKNLKIVSSLILIVVTSWLHLAITQPCKNPVGRMCDYSVGFPFAFWLVTDYIGLFMLIWFFIGIALNFVVWYVLLSLVFYSIQKTARALKL